MKLRFAFIVLLVSTSAMAEGTSRGHGGGGWYKDFHPIVEQYNASGELFRIQGNCQSACTLFLGIRNVCIEPSAVLRFHAGHDQRRIKTELATSRLMAAYNEPLKAYLNEHHAMDRVDPFFPISGRDMIHKFGYHQCPRH